MEQKNKDSTLEVGKFQPQIDELKTTLQNVKSDDSQKFSKLDDQVKHMSNCSSTFFYMSHDRKKLGSYNDMMSSSASSRHIDFRTITLV